MAVILSALRALRTLLPRNIIIIIIIIIMFLVLISARAWINPQGLVRPERLRNLKKITLSGIEPATFRFVAYCLNHYATACSN
jgi:hypothetical protein